MSSESTGPSQSTTSKSSSGNNKICKVVIQQCREASLKFDTDDPPVSIGPGMVVFVCFLQGATLDKINSIVKSILNVKLSEPEIAASSDGKNVADSNPRRKSVLDCNYDILVIPQATLGGKLKGTATQYHGLVSKDLGHELFHALVNCLKEGGPSSWTGKVENGVYGARQILRMDTNGPFTHMFEF